MYSSLYYTVIQILLYNPCIQITLLQSKHVNAAFMKLSPCLRLSFRNDRKCGPFNGVINTFSLDTEGLIQKYKDVELQLIFLKTEVKCENNTNLSISALSSCLSMSRKLKKGEQSTQTSSLWLKIDEELKTKVYIYTVYIFELLNYLYTVKNAINTVNIMNNADEDATGLCKTTFQFTFQ